MESHGGFRSLPTIEEVVTTLILLCAALYSQLKSEMESLMGFRFQPSNEQIICLLEKKRLNPRFLHHTIKDIDDICSLEPWDLAGASKTESEDQVCYFFYKPYYKYKESTRAHRRTNAGYWKVTGRGSKIKTRNGLSGIKKILTFYYHGPASKKAKTGWVMHEYHVNDDPSYKKEFVLCRIERKCENKHGISTSDEGESRQQLVSPIQLSPRDPRNLSEENTPTYSQQLPNHNLISCPGNHIEQNTPTFPQVNDLINSQRAFQGENSRKDTGQTLTPDLNSSKSDGGTSTYAEDSSDPNNTAYIDAWLDEPLEDGGASTYAKDSSDPNNIAYIDTWLDEPLEAGRASTLAEDSSDTNNTAYMDGWINGLLL
ncbi:NAC domain-containing protein 86 [Citrus sinensis]|nr:NAC domain-containing protein 86 [Citrus sinensis]